MLLSEKQHNSISFFLAKTVGRKDFNLLCVSCALERSKRSCPASPEAGLPNIKALRCFRKSSITKSPLRLLRLGENPIICPASPEAGLLIQKPQCCFRKSSITKTPLRLLRLGENPIIYPASPEAGLLIQKPQCCFRKSSITKTPNSTKAFWAF